MDDIFELSITRDELAAVRALIAAAQARGLTEQLEEQFGEEFGVAYASLILKMAMAERRAVPGETPRTRRRSRYLSPTSTSAGTRRARDRGGTE